MMKLRITLVSQQQALIHLEAAPLSGNTPIMSEKLGLQQEEI